MTSPSPFGFNATIADTNAQSAALLSSNPELQWQEGYYRGYYELSISGERVRAAYFGLPDVRTRNGYEVSLGNFTVLEGGNGLERPVGGGSVESGALQGNGSVAATNLTRDTNNGAWEVREFDFVGVTIPGSD